MGVESSGQPYGAQHIIPPSYALKQSPRDLPAFEDHLLIISINKQEERVHALGLQEIMSDQAVRRKIHTVYAPKFN